MSAGTAALAAGSTLRSYADSAAMTKGRPLGVAILGLGRYASGEIAPSLRETKLCRLVGAISGHPAKLEAWSKQYNLPKKNLYSYDTMDQIADNPDIDFVYVITPPGTHKDFAVRCAKAGKHVLSEKPLATSVAECDAMIAACREAKVKFSVGYRLHFDPIHLEMARLSRDLDFGVFKTMTGNRGFVFGQRAWRVDKKLAGGGPMYDLGIYLIQGAIMAQNEVTPLSVEAHELPKKRPEFFNEVEETMQFALNFPNGSRLEAIAGYNHSSDTFKAVGDKGWIDFRQHAFTYRGATVVSSRGPVVSNLKVHQQAVQMDDFADCIMTGRETPVPGEMGRRDIRILEAIYESAAKGKQVTV